MRQLLPEHQREASDDQIIGTLACMVGGVILARTVGGKDSAAVLDACREFLRRNAGQSGKALKQFTDQAPSASWHHSPREESRRFSTAIAVLRLPWEVTP